jgi:hypothetical protein
MISVDGCIGMEVKCSLFIRDFLGGCLVLDFWRFLEFFWVWFRDLGRFKLYF